jgi:MtfA peptidase
VNASRPSPFLAVARWLPAWAQVWLPRKLRQPPAIPDRLWQETLATHPFLDRLAPDAQQRLRWLSQHFLLEKEFHGAHGLEVSDAMAVAIAAQACLPLLHLGGVGARSNGDPLKALDWYGDFVGIVVQPGAAVAQREIRDASGVVHHYREVLAGEAMNQGPIMLSWEQVARAGHDAQAGSNVVIHEFVHKFDMQGTGRYGYPDGAPMLPPGFMGARTAGAAGTIWRDTMMGTFETFREAVVQAERFGGETPWLDSYAAKDPAEFFAVTCEAYFVNRERFSTEFPALLALYNAFFEQELFVSA